jgi:Erv1 / Alr family
MLVARVRKTLRRVRAALTVNVSTLRSKNAVMCPNSSFCVLLGVCLVALGLSVVLQAGPVSESLGISTHLLRSRHYIESSSVYLVEKPPDKRELGRATWTAFHTLAANFPEKPTDDDKKHAEAFVRSLTRLYPCKLCRDHFDRFVSVTPPE